MRRILENRLRRRRQIRSPADQLRHCVENCVHHLLACVARGDGLLRPEAGNRLLPSRLQRARLRPLKLRRRLRKCGFVPGKQLVPLRLGGRATLHRFAPVSQRFVRHIKILVLGEPEELFRRRCIRCAHGFAVHFICSRKRAAVADNGAHGNQRWFADLGLRRYDGLLNTLHIVAVHHPLHMPAVRLEAVVNILGKAPVGRPIERDQIVVVKHNQLAQPERSRQRGRLMRQALHQIAVAAHDKRVMIHHVEARPVVRRGQMLLRNSHAHAHSESLSKGTSRRLHAIGQAVLRVPRRLRSPCAEALQIVQRHLVAGKK